MAVTYVAGNRAIGTNAERLALNSLQVSGVGGWKELARTTLGSSSSTIDVTSLPNKRYYMILNTQDYYAYGRVGNSTVDTGTNYAERYSFQGTGETAVPNYNWITMQAGGGVDGFGVTYWANYSTKEKLHIGHYVDKNATGAANAPKRSETVGKWTNTSNPIDRFHLNTQDANTFSSGSEVVVLGWDPADTHTTNFWTELSSTTLSSTASTIDSGTIPAKKYLWIQAFVKQASTYTVGLQFNSDNTSSYAIRYSGNGGADGTSINTWKCASNYSSFGGGMFLNAFIINNQSKEKLVISHTNEVDTTGAGAASNRIEMVGKWANTSNQITSIQLRKETGTGDLQSGTIMKVWGSN